MNNERASYINLIGTVEANGKFRFEKLMPVDKMPQWPVMNTRDLLPAVVIEFQNKAGEVVMRQAIGAQAICMHPPLVPTATRPADVYIFGGIVPLPADALKLKIMDMQSVKAEFKIPSVGPRLNFKWTASAKNLKGIVKLTWKAGHPEKIPLTHTVCRVDKEGNWQSLTLASPAMSAEIDFDKIAGGSFAIGIMTTDGFNIAKALSPVIELPMKPCTPIITSPAEGAKFKNGERILLQGHGYYREEKNIENRWLFWSDNKEGQLGPGREFDVILKPGKHTLTLRAGLPGREEETSVTIMVEK